MKITNENYIVEDDREIDVEIDYRCFFTEKQAFAPMEVMTSIYKGHTLFDAIEEGKKSYEKDYLKVEVMEVRADI